MGGPEVREGELSRRFTSLGDGRFILEEVLGEGVGCNESVFWNF